MLKKRLPLIAALLALTGCVSSVAQIDTPTNANTSMNNKVLIVLTNQGKLGNTDKKTGFFLAEAAHPYAVFTKAGLEVDFVSPSGGEAPIDPKSYQLDDLANRAFVENKAVMAKVNNTLSPSEVNPDEYKAILYAGGHGAMWDFPNNQPLADLTSAIYEQGGVVGAVCHGPVGLVNVKLSNGQYLVDDKTVAAFTNEEEAAVGLTKVVPFLLESKLTERGAIHTKAANFQSHVVVSDRLVTGQNPASAAGVGEAMAKLLIEN